MAFASIFSEKETEIMVNIVTWVQTQGQERIVEIEDKKAMPKTSQFKVLENLEKAYQKNDVEKLVFWLAYAKVYDFTITEGHKFFKKIEEEWPSGHHYRFANAFHFLNAIYAQGYTERNNSEQMYNYTVLLAEFSQV